MKSLNGFFIVGLLSILCGVTTHGQKSQLMPDNLIQITDELPVKVGAQWVGKIYKMKFGNYSIVDSKMGWTTTTQKSKLFSRKTSSKSSQKFSFTLTDGNIKSIANVTNRIETEYLRELLIASKSFKNSEITIETDEELLVKDNLLNGIINLENDTTETWTFTMRSMEGTQVTDQKTFVAKLTNGEKSFYLFPIVSKGKSMLPALGYIFINEAGEPLAALQFFGGGMMGANQNVIWLPKEYDPRIKIIMASALTAVLQIKMGTTSF